MENRDVNSGDMYKSALFFILRLGVAGALNGKKFPIEICFFWYNSHKIELKSPGRNKDRVV